MLSSMKLVFLHGSPAVGKLTVAKALLSMVSGRLFDNHAAIDLARTVFDFGAPGFWELVHSVRCSAIDAAAQHGVSLVVTTFCYVLSFVPGPNRHFSPRIGAWRKIGIQP